MLNGCQVTVGGTALVDVEGDPDSATVVTGRAGDHRPEQRQAARDEEQHRDLPHRGCAPATAGANISPPFTLVTKPACNPSLLTACLMPCPCAATADRASS
jgi:hypothetical protein